MNKEAATQQRSDGSGNHGTAAIRERPGRFKAPATLKGWFLLGTGALLCPCHLPLTLFVLTALFAGTAFGGFLADNIWLIGGTIAVYSITALILGYRMLKRTYGWRVFG